MQTESAVIAVWSACKQQIWSPGQSDFCTQPKRADVDALLHCCVLATHEYLGKSPPVSTQHTFVFKLQPAVPTHVGFPEVSNFTLVGTCPPWGSHPPSKTLPPEDVAPESV